MKNKWKLCSIVLALIAFVFFFLIFVSSTASAGSTQLEGSQIVITETQITTNESDQWGPSIYGDKIVWYDTRNRNNYDLYMYNLSTHNETRITTRESMTYFPTIYGDRIVWDNYHDGNHYICIYNTTTCKETCKETQTTANRSLHNNLAIYEDKIVWDSFRNGNYDIYMYNLSTDKETQITTNESNQQNPAIYEDFVVWDDWRNGNLDIYMYDLSTHKETQITTNESDQFLPNIYNDRIVWQDYSNENLNMYNISSCKKIQITVSPRHYSHKIYGDKIIWSDFHSIYLYDLSVSKEFQINIDESRSEKSTPAIYGDRIVWQDWRDENYDIYMCTINSNLSTAMFSASPISGKVPLGVTFTDNNMDTSTVLKWDFGDGATSTEKNPEHIYSNIGTYTVSLTESNSVGSATKKIVKNLITVSEAPKLPVANFSATPMSGNSPLSVQFIDLSENVTSLCWDFENDGIIDSIDKNPVYTYTSPGTYTAKLTAINANSTTEKTVTITVNEEEEEHHSSGGSGGSGGGSPEPARNIEVKELSQAFVTNGNPIKFDFTNNATCVVSVSFDAKKTVGKTTTIVEQLKNKSTLTSNLTEGEVYKYFNVWVGNSGFASSDNIENPAICFKVEKSWIQDNKIDQASVLLNRYSNKIWEQLPVSLSGEDSEYLYFTANVPGYTYFAITGKSDLSHEGIITKIQPEDSDNTEDIKNSGSEINTEPEEEKKTGIPGFDMVYGIAGLLGVFLYRRR
ncbi:PGF-pre-PGF domain-containing protein [Methanosarcina sp. UBA411]|uniref:PGF-pre-PGF domain-containing protein n=1 Tax=Methanosarcina sp. UBA411 TaxID=1915589 RepID=UPI0025EDE786|nr:PGF-pre-PGF domain-containing protein [Methanosarcina sp. UBA411]